MILQHKGQRKSKSELSASRDVGAEFSRFDPFASIAFWQVGAWPKFGETEVRTRWGRCPGAPFMPLLIVIVFRFGYAATQVFRVSIFGRFGCYLR